MNHNPRTALSPIRNRRYLHMSWVCQALLVVSIGCTAHHRATDFLVAPEVIRADFRELYSRIQAAHFDLFVHVPKADFDAEFKRTLAELDRPMSLDEIRVRFQQFLAFGRVGHSRIEFPSEAYARFRAEGGKAVALWPRVIDGRVYISEDHSGLKEGGLNKGGLNEGGLKADAGLDRSLVGYEILALNGLPIDAWLRRLTAHISAEQPEMAYALLEFRFPQLLWLELGSVESVTLQVRDGRGKVASLTVPTRTRDEIEAAVANAGPALALDWVSRQAKIVESSQAGPIAYLRPGPFYEPSNGEDPFDSGLFRQFIDDAFKSFLEAEAQSLLIDLRDSPGGDSSFSDLMVAWFADQPFRFCADFRVKVSEETTASNQKRVDVRPGDKDNMSYRYAQIFDQHAPGDIVSIAMPEARPRDDRRFLGKVYLLVNRHSFSNTVNVAALVQDYGFGMVLGEPTTDLATTYGAMEQFTLSRTAIEVGYPKAYIIRPNGDQTIAGVTPDVEIETPLFQGPEDPVLQEAVRHIEGVAASAG